jgi:hypothetical protein
MLRFLLMLVAAIALGLGTAGVLHIASADVTDDGVILVAQSSNASPNAKKSTTAKKKATKKKATKKKAKKKAAKKK